MRRIDFPSGDSRKRFMVTRKSKRSLPAAALRETADGLRRAQAMANLAHVITRPDGSFESWSETLPRVIGVKPGDMIASTRDWLAFIHPDDRIRFRATALEARAKGSRTEIQYRIRRPDGAWIHVRQVMEPIGGARPGQRLFRWFNTIQDVTQQVEAQTRIGRLNRVYAVLSGINSAIVRLHDAQELFEEACRLAVEDGKFVMAWIGLVDHQSSLVKPIAMAGNVGTFFDEAPMAVLETKPGGHGLSGRAVRSKRPVISNDVRTDPQRLMRKELAERGINSLAILPFIVRDAVIGVIAFYSADAGFFDADEMKLLGELAGDVAYALDHIEKAKRLDYLSYYDPLTGLPNRTLFHERLHLQLQEAAGKQQSVALLLLDLERFKTINDAFGRQAGDAILTQLAVRMKQLSLPTSWFARVGPDQFAIITPEVTIEEELAARTEHRLAETFGPPFTILDRDLRISARVGISIFPGDGTDSDALLRNAEAALKNAKASGERYMFYRQDMTARIAEKLTLENKLRLALERQEFVLHYQPKIALSNRAITGFEALIRWQSPELGLVSPGEFIPLLEQTGLILQVGYWALKRASLDHRSWHERGLNPPQISVNVSAIQLRQRDFVPTVRQAVTLAVAPQVIELEITESNVMEDIRASVEKLSKVRDIGLEIAIDDFGTGYSSLAYLARLPIQTLKIDRSFVHAMMKEAAAGTLVETIVSLAHTLRLKVVAEGVETDDQLNALAALGCDQLQGYVFSKPVPPEAVPSLLDANSYATGR